MLENNLQGGVDRLDAQRLDSDRWLYWDDATRAHYVCSSDDVHAAGRMDAWDYSLWCADTWARRATSDDLRRIGAEV